MGRKIICLLLVIAVMLVCMTGCSLLEKLGIGKKSEPTGPQALATPTLAINGDTLTWGLVANAAEYRVKFVLGDDTIYRTTDKNTYTVPDLAVGRYTVSVMARVSNENKARFTDSAYSNEVTYVKKAALLMGNIEVATKGEWLWVSWSAVDHASGYEVILGDAAAVSTNDLFYNFDVAPQEETDVKVRAIGSDLYVTSEWATTSFDPATAVQAQDLEFDRKDGELRLDYQALSAKLDDKPIEINSFSTYFTIDLSKVAVGAHTLRVITTGETKLYALTLTDSRDPVYQIDGSVNWERHSAQGVTVRAVLYGAEAASLTLGDTPITYRTETVEGIVNLTADIDIDTLNAFAAGTHKLTLNYRKGNVAGNVKADVVLTNRAFELAKTDYDYGGGDLVVSIYTHGDTITSVRIGATNHTSDSFTTGINTLKLPASLFDGKVGEVEVVIKSSLVPLGCSITVTIGSEDLVLSEVEYLYDKHEGGNLVLQGYLFNDVVIYGGDIHTYFRSGDYVEPGEYTLTVGANGVTIKEAYLMSLPAGEYAFLSKGETIDTCFTITVYDSDAAPQDVRLNYDISATTTYITYHCDCGEDDHTVKLDGVTKDSSFKVDCGSVDRTKAHTVSVTCNTTGNKTDLNLTAPSMEAQSYMAAPNRYTSDGEDADLYIDSQAELNHAIKWLSYGGNYSATGTYGTSSAVMYLGDRYYVGLDLNDALSAATASFDTPFSSNINMSVSGGRVLTVTITFTSPVLRNAVSGQPIVDSAETNRKPQAVGSGRSLYIDGVSTTQLVRNVAELADLPFGVRPTFDGSTNSARARSVYEAAKEVCDQYLADSMTAYQKVTTIYEWLATNVTYDRYTLVWYELSAKVNGGYYDYLTQLKDEVYAKKVSPEYAGNATMGAYFDRILDTSSLAEARAELDEILHTLSVFDAYGALVDNRAVCDGISDAFRIMCLIEGIDCLKVSGLGKTDSGMENHAWNKVFIDGDWYVVDATWGRSGNYLSHAWLLLPESAVVGNHIEQRSFDATSIVGTLAQGEYDYFRSTKVNETDDLYIENKAEFVRVFNTLWDAGQRVMEFRMGFAYNLNDMLGDTKFDGKSYNTSTSGDILLLILP